MVRAAGIFLLSLGRRRSVNGHWFAVIRSSEEVEWFAFRLGGGRTTKRVIVINKVCPRFWVAADAVQTLQKSTHAAAVVRRALLHFIISRDVRFDVRCSSPPHKNQLPSSNFLDAAIHPDSNFISDL